MEQARTYTDMKEKTGYSIAYVPESAGGVFVQARREDGDAEEAAFKPTRVDEAKILFVEASEVLESRAEAGASYEEIRHELALLFSAFRGEKPAFPRATAHEPSREIKPNPGKQLEIDVDGSTWLRLPIRTRLITAEDRDILPLIEEYAKPHLKEGDTLYISEKALTVTQGRVVDMSDIHPGKLARFLAKRVGTGYGTNDFRGFGHGTSLGMQLLIEESGSVRAFLAAVLAAITRPFGIRGMFYRAVGKKAKSIDCPMSFLILEYAHAAKKAPKNPSGEANRIKAALGCEVVILDANYRGAFSLGKSKSAPSEQFIGKLFRDNPLGQSDEMTPFCIARRT